MPFVKTEVDIKTDYSVETVDAEWLKQGVKSPKHLMLDPEPCILCRACEDVCPWNCIFMLDPGIVLNSEDDAVEAEVENAFAIFVVDDNACTRCRALPQRLPVLCAPARGGTRWAPHDGRGANIAEGGRRRRVGPRGRK